MDAKDAKEGDKKKGNRHSSDFTLWILAFARMTILLLSFASFASFAVKLYVLGRSKH